MIIYLKKYIRIYILLSFNIAPSVLAICVYAIRYITFYWGNLNNHAKFRSFHCTFMSRTACYAVVVLWRISDKSRTCVWIYPWLISKLISHIRKDCLDMVVDWQTPLGGNNFVSYSVRMSVGLILLKPHLSRTSFCALIRRLYRISYLYPIECARRIFSIKPAELGLYEQALSESTKTTLIPPKY